MDQKCLFGILMIEILTYQMLGTMKIDHVLTIHVAHKVACFLESKQKGAPVSMLFGWWFLPFIERASPQAIFPCFYDTIWGCWLVIAETRPSIESHYQIKSHQTHCCLLVKGEWRRECMGYVEVQLPTN
jgi:hypothetical protein